MLQMTHIVSKLQSPDPNAVTTGEILKAIESIALAASQRMSSYLPVIHVKAKEKHLTTGHKAH